MRHWIFSYGTLAHKDVAEKTGKTLSFKPAILKDHLRNFRVRIPSRGFAAAGIEFRKGERTMGMLVEVPEEELSKFDEREYCYNRRQVDPELLSSIEGELPEGTFHVYIPQNPEPPTEEMPLAQSYIDVILEAFLDRDEALAKKVLDTTLDLDRPWLNDRAMPRYSRYLEDLDTDRIDSFLKAQVPEDFEKRQEEKVIPIKEDLAESMIKTIAFYDLFEFSLLPEELIGSLYKYDKPVHIKEVKATLDHLVERGQLAELKGYYILPGRERIIETRKTRKFIAEKFWNRTKLYGTYMKRVPFVEMIAVCNNLAYDNPSELSDIDLFIVVRPGRMWLARLIITAILHFYGVRRHGDKVAGRFCLSFFVTDKKLQMEEFEMQPQDPYLAYWTKNLQPIFGDETYQKFREKNAGWLASYGLRFGDGYRKHMYHETKSRLKKFLEWMLGGGFGNLIEGFLKRTIKQRSLRKMEALGSEANVIVTDDILKFHNKDRRRQYYENWLEKLNQA